MTGNFSLFYPTNMCEFIEVFARYKIKYKCGIMHYNVSENFLERKFAPACANLPHKENLLKNLQNLCNYADLIQMQKYLEQQKYLLPHVNKDRS